jgi:hypothetical protein
VVEDALEGAAHEESAQDVAERAETHERERARKAALLRQKLFGDGSQAPFAAEPQSSVTVPKPSTVSASSPMSSQCTFFRVTVPST